MAGVPVEAIPIYHGKLPITAFRMGRFAYVTDVSHVPQESMERLLGLDNYAYVLGDERVGQRRAHVGRPVQGALGPQDPDLEADVADSAHRHRHAITPPGALGQGEQLREVVESCRVVAFAPLPTMHG